MHELLGSSYLQRYQNGVALTHHEQIATFNLNINELFNLPIQSYFYNLDHTFYSVNSLTAKLNGFVTEQDAIGKTLSDVITSASAETIRRNNQSILQTEMVQIVEECIIRNDEEFLEGISIKFPWYHKNKLAGLFGVSFVVNSPQSFVQNMNLLAKIGLIHFPFNSMKYATKRYYFSKRERELLFHLVRGKTAKEIGEILKLSKRTIEHYLENIKVKTRSTTRSELIDKVFELFQ